jgi:V/A-type H+-transporting ATPase subunit I
MIVKMKKYTFLIFHKEYHAFLYALRALGVMHIVEKQCGTPEENSDLYGFVNNGKRFGNIIKALKKIQEDKKIKDLHPENKKENGIALLEKVEQLYADREQAVFRKNVIAKELERIEPWGYFDLQLFRKLEQTNLFVHFHSASESKFQEQWIDDYNAIKINQHGSTVYFVTITKETTHPDINAEQIKPFEDSATNLETALFSVNEDIQRIDDTLKTMVINDLNTLIYKEKETADQINWEKVALSSETAAEEKLHLLEGFVPEEQETEISAALQNKGVYFEVSTPTLDEKPPVLLKNNRFASAFELIADIYDRPNYHAFDLTAFFAPFYMFFFGLCVGDCGYGLIYIALSFYFRKSKDPFMSAAGRLALWLGIGTVIAGFFSGGFFGIPLADQSWSWMEKAKTLILEPKQLFNLALILGVIQLIYAMFVKTVTTWMRFGVLAALDTIGWIFTIFGVGIYVLAKKGFIAIELPVTFLYIILGIGLFLMLFFNSTDKGLKGIPGSVGAGVWGLYGKISGLMGDILSYIRLFAVGITGGVLGLVFNKLAFSFAPDVIIAKQLVILIILVVGHAVNIFLCSLGGFVHPMRLTFVEFYNNAGFEGGGKKYKPFRKNVNI